jgi:hypothetical protein
MTKYVENVIETWSKKSKSSKQFLILEGMTSPASVAFRRRHFRKKPLYSPYGIAKPLRSPLTKTASNQLKQTQTGEMK